MQEITTKNNKLFISAKKLFEDKKYRDATNLFICETNKVIQTLIENGFQPRNILVSKSSKYINLYKNNENNFVLSDNYFNSLSNLASGDGVIGIFTKPKNSFDFSEGKFIVLDRIQNPGNLGTIIRTMVAFDVKKLIISNDSVDLYNPTTIRASMGGSLLIDAYFTTDLLDTVAKLKKTGVKVFGTALNEKAVPLNKVEFPNSCAVILGNEGAGVSKNVLKNCDEIVYIPMNPKIDSLNVSIATGIILNKIYSK
ncbi:MAG: RNA methyltransferase [Mycoplasmataceae bacterium]|jgi:TrmH family RNA methyltransferase|nr:RNA methyltransferase [Mycoplasmataceae bacterium]